MAVKVQLKNNGSTGTTSKPTASSQLHGELFVDTVNGELNFVNQNKDGWHTLSSNPDPDFSNEITAAGGIGNNGNALIFHDNCRVYNAEPKLSIRNNSTNSSGTATLELYALDTGLNYQNQTEYTSWRIKKNNAAGSGISSYNGRLEFGIVQLQWGTYAETEYTRAWITTTGNMYTSGSYSNSSRELKESISSLSEELAVETVMSLEPVHYKYKQDPEENHIGFIAEDTSELLTDKEKKAIPALDVIATVTKVVQKQEKEINELKKEIEDLKNLILNSGVN